MVISAMRGTLKAAMLQALIDRQFYLFESIGNRNLFVSIAKDLFPHVTHDYILSLSEYDLIEMITCRPITEDNVDFIATERDTFDYLTNVI